ncbi:MAG TPA: hypothetical protein VF069_21440 [Streptosporangiaceae bacterium]
MVVAEAPAEEALLALTLITTWALATGRAVRSDVPPGQLTEDELIEFWADPLIGDESSQLTPGWAARL